MKINTSVCNLQKVRFLCEEDPAGYRIYIMKTKSLSLTNTILFPEIIDSRRDNSPFLYLNNSKELERYFEVLISLYPIADSRLLHATRKIKDSIDSL